MRPGTAAEAAEVLRGLAAEGARVRPRGSGTKPWGPPSSGEILLETGGLDRILEHNVGDFTAVLEAGVRLADAQAAFAEHGQMLAIDPPLGAGDGATLGGVLAANDSGPLRHRYGGMRDLVVGVTVALSDGTLASSGGRVIKNVAGYDLAKLLCGSFGGLGVVVRIAVRLHPRASDTATAVAGTDDATRLGAAAAILAGLPLESDSLDAEWRDGAGRLLVRFAGPTAAERARAALRPLADARLQDAAVVEDDGALWAAQRARQRGDCVVKVSGRITDLPAVCATGAAVVARAGLGLAWCQVAPDAVDDLVTALAPRACTVLDGPEALRARAWPPPDPGTLALMRRLEERFDPAGILR